MINFKNVAQKDKFLTYMKKMGIIIQFHYKPIYKFKIGKKLSKLPGSEKYYRTAISLPIYVGLRKKTNRSKL